MERVRKAIVTGASSGIGLGIAHLLRDLGYEVYGIGRKFKEEETDRFHHIVLDLLDTEELLKVLKNIGLHEVDLVVNNAGCAWYGIHENVDLSSISTMVRTNLEVPMLITKTVLPYIRKNKGTLLYISSMTAVKSSPHGAAYGATKAGLLAFSNSILEENRKHGVRVSCILPDMTDTDLYRNADFKASNEDGCALSVKDVAEAVRYILSLPTGVQVPVLEILPQYHRIMKK